MLKILILRFYKSIKVNGLIKTLFSIPRRIIEQKKSSNFQRSIKISSLISRYKQLPITIKTIRGYPIDLNLIKQKKKNIKQINKNQKELTALTFGIYDDISFEIELKNIGLDVYSFDPSPISIKLFEDDPELSKNIFFKPVGLWVYDGSVKFYESDPTNVQSADNKEYSIVNISNSDKFIEFECKELNTIIKEIKLISIDYLKLDIEGAVPAILNQYFNKNKIILPEQICFELEFPEKHNSENFYEMMRESKILLEKMNSYYEIFYLPKRDMFSHIIIYGRLKKSRISN
jgi:FkbM family methyltransferase